MDLGMRPRKARGVFMGLIGCRLSKCKVLRRVLLRLLAWTWMTYMPVSGNVSCCWLLALKVTIGAAVGENTVAVAVAPKGKPAAEIGRASCREGVQLTVG